MAATGDNMAAIGEIVAAVAENVVAVVENVAATGEKVAAVAENVAAKAEWVAVRDKGKVAVVGKSREEDRVGAGWKPWRGGLREREREGREMTWGGGG